MYRINRANRELVIKYRILQDRHNTHSEQSQQTITCTRSLSQQTHNMK